MSIEIPVELQNLDVPGVDNFSHYQGDIYYCWQPETNNTNKLNEDILLVRVTSGRWVITNSITNPSAAYIGTYNGDYYRIDQAIEQYKKDLDAAKS